MSAPLALRIIRHEDVCGHPYDVFCAAIETRKWAFGFRVHDWRDRPAMRGDYGLRVMFWRWHLCWHRRAK